MKSLRKMRNAFGVNDFGLTDFPVGVSNVQIARIAFGDKRGCSRCSAWIRNRQFHNRQSPAELETLQKNAVEMTATK